MAAVDDRAAGGQGGRRFAFVEVGAADSEIPRQQHAGDGRQTGAADANKMNALSWNQFQHAFAHPPPISVNRAAKRRAPSGLARALACACISAS